VNIDAAVDTLRVDFTAAGGFTSPIIQVVLVETGNVVRDILRSDRTTWSRTIGNARGGTNLDHVLIVVCGTNVGGSFALSVQAVSAAPDVMVSRWHHVAGTHYEIDSFGWAWTWVSPDIWVDNDGNGLADSEVFFNHNNKLFIRLRNQGRANATGISVQFWYQDASGGLHDAAWLPVQNTSGVTQTLTGLSLAAGATNQWSVEWSPLPSGTSHHFCVRAVVSVPGDPNSDNKCCLSNFGNVIVAGPYIDLRLLRRSFLKYPDVRIDVIPRSHGRWIISATDLARAAAMDLRPGDEIVDSFRLRRRNVSIAKTGRIAATSSFVEQRPQLARLNETRRERRPDAFGHYSTDPRALPPGVAQADLITIVHTVNGKPIGGFTWAIRSTGN
jgi:hypothetical protein